MTHLKLFGIDNLVVFINIIHAAFCFFEHFILISPTEKPFRKETNNNNNSQYYNFYGIFDQINAALVALRELFKKKEEKNVQCI